VIEALKPTYFNRLRRPVPTHVSATQGDGDGKAVQEHRQPQLPPIQGATGDPGAGIRRNVVVQRWQRAAAAAVVINTVDKLDADTVPLTTGETGLFYFISVAAIGAVSNRFKKHALYDSE